MSSEETKKDESVLIGDGAGFFNIAPISPAVVTIGPNNKKPFIITIDNGWIDDETKKFMENSDIASVDATGRVSIDFMSVIKRLAHIERVLEEKADWFQIDPPTVKKD